jgi:predicted ABC-type ATPase
MSSKDKKYLYIIAGPNGAGKTTASMTILPEVLNCSEFVNADIIAYGLSPFNPESVAIQAGRMMLTRIDELLNENNSFAVETTLANKTYTILVKKAKERGFEVILLYFWLSSVQQAINRVEKRVLEGGHNIPKNVIERRYKTGLQNLFNIYLDICDVTQVYDNTFGTPNLIFEKENGQLNVFNQECYNLINRV